MTLADLYRSNVPTTYIHPTERSARSARSAFSKLSLDTGRKAWESIHQMLTITRFMEKLWKDGNPDKQLLQPVQFLSIVKQVVDSTEELGQELISSMSVSRKVASAFNRFHQYMISDDPEYYSMRRETQLFHRWQGEIKKRLGLMGMTVPALLPTELTLLIQNKTLPVSGRVVLMKGAALMPSEKSLMATMVLNGIEFINLNDDHCECTQVPVNEFSSEINESKYVAAQCKAILDGYISNPADCPTIGILVPDVLDLPNGSLITQLSYQVAPQSLVDVTGSTVPFEVSGAEYLGSQPEIGLIMSLLRASAEHIELSDLSSLLRSPDITGYEAERYQRASLDLRFRDLPKREQSLDECLKALKVFGAPAQIPVFYRAFEGLVAFHAQTDRLPPSAWVQSYISILTAFGLMGDETRTSAYRSLTALGTCFTEFGSMDRMLGDIRHERAVMWLRECVDTRHYQVKKFRQTPIKIMKYEDAIGLEFDHLFIVGCSSGVLPKPVTIDPFIPTVLQEKSKVDGCTADLAFEKARRQIAMFCESAVRAEFCFHKTNTLGQPQTPSPLFGLVTSMQDAQLGCNRVILGTLDREAISEDPILPVHSVTSEPVTGGTSILKDYAVNPFYAFARHRLGLKPFPASKVGLNPSSQGIALHEALEHFWVDVKTSENLQRMATEEKASLIESCVVKSMEGSANLADWMIGDGIYEIEKARLVQIVLDWVAKEEARTEPFEVILTEHTAQVMVENLPMTIRLDRVDRVNSLMGEKVVLIDYKTGSVFNMKDLNSDRLVEPQLPLYCLYSNLEDVGIEAIDGVSIAHVHPSDMKFHVRSSWANGFHKKRSSPYDVANPAAWDSQKLSWEAGIVDAAKGFMNGLATFDYSKDKVDMFYEDLAPLLRIHGFNRQRDTTQADQAA